MGKLNIDEDGFVEGILCILGQKSENLPPATRAENLAHFDIV